MAPFQPQRACEPRAAMTLVELLVVVAIMLLLLVTVIPNLAPSADQKCREAALTLTAAITRAQSRAAANSGRGAGLWLQPLETSAMPSADTTRGSVDLFVCEPQDNYVGDDPELARAFITTTDLRLSDPFPPDMAVATFSITACPFIHDVCARSSLIRLDGVEYYFNLKSPAEKANLNEGYFPAPYRRCNHILPDPSTSQYTDSQIRSRDEVAIAFVKAIPPNTNRPAQTTPLYTPPPLESGLPGQGVGAAFSIVRPMTRSASPPLSLPAGYIVDIAWCCVGTTLLTNTFARRDGTPFNMRCIDNFLSNHPVHIMFNESSGAIDRLRYKIEVPNFGVVDEDRSVTSDIYLLIGRADRAGNAYLANPADDTIGANWQYPDSRWVRISRSNGETLIADPVLKVPDVFQSQGYVRAGLEATRK